MGMPQPYGVRAARRLTLALACAACGATEVMSQLCPAGFSDSFASVGGQARLRGFRNGDDTFGALYGVGCTFTQVGGANASACEDSCVASSACQGYEFIAALGECA